MAARVDRGGVSVGLLCAGLVIAARGALIQRHSAAGPVPSASSIILAAGLAILAIAPSLPVFLLGWLVIGLGMDRAFMTRPSRPWAGSSAAMRGPRSRQ